MKRCRGRQTVWEAPNSVVFFSAVTTKLRLIGILNSTVIILVSRTFLLYKLQIDSGIWKSEIILFVIYERFKPRFRFINMFKLYFQVKTAFDVF